MERIEIKKCTLIRGVPGTGKSTFAKSLGCFHIEADMYHIHNGAYQFDPSSVSQAHEWCFGVFTQAISYGVDVVVSNTFTRRNEIDRYIELATDCGYEVEIIALSTEFKSVHNVPEPVMIAMRERWEAIEGERKVVLKR